MSALREAFERECRELGLLGRLEEAEGLWQPRFEPQFGAQGAWLDGILLEELRARAIADACGWPRRAHPSAAELEGLREALRRTRARLVDGDSWIAGGFEFPWPVADERVRTRGLASYRAPARAAAVLELGAGRARITIEEGDCGAVVSAGFWVPTPLAGDFEVALDYRLLEWCAGAREACLALTAVAPDGTFRAYAQRVERAGEPARVVADLDGRPGPGLQSCAGNSGTLRIVRAGAQLALWHRDGPQWRWLGRIREELERALLVGFKTWASGSCGRLCAQIERLALDARAAEALEPVPPPRRDPRQPA